MVRERESKSKFSQQPLIYTLHRRGFTYFIHNIAQLSKIATVYTLTYVRNLVNWKDQAYINIAAEKLVQFIGDNKI